MPQPTSKHHAEWLSLLEISGPFLSMPVLTNAFPQGLEELPDGLARSLRADYAFWQEKAQDPAVHTAWIRLVLESLLGYEGETVVTGQAISAGWKAEFPEHEETLRPDMMLVEPGSRAPHLLIQVFPPSQNLEKAVQGSRWQASVSTRMMELLHATEVKLGLVTNGEQWMLVHAPRGETTGFATWYAGLWFDERITLQAFQSLLGVRRFFGVAEEQTLERLLASSANDQQEITDQLGLQVRHAVEILIQKIDEADQTSGGALLTGIGVEPENVPTLLYETSLTVMMRLVFLLSAEERKLLPLDDSLYAENYAVSTLRAQLRELADQQGEEVLERRFDAWSRLLAIFRAVHGGIRHERLSLPPYGGSLFDPQKYPFLEGRTTNDERQRTKAVPLPVDNRTVLHLLESLQILQVDGEARRLSFRALDVEQIGHVYEGLLDHRAVRASEPMLGLRGAKRLEPEIRLSELEQVAGRKESDLIAWLKNATGRSDSALKNALASDILIKESDFASRLRSKCADEALFGRLAPFAGLLRLDDFGFPVVILAGSVYVTSGTTRRATGTHYTPRSLTEPVVQHTLEPLVYVGPAEGLPREQWTLKSPADLLDLKICDMAMGSGGFLVQVVRYMAERLVESMQNDEFRMQKPEPNSSFFMLNSALTAEDTLNYARRLVAERCIYGVDKNPLAVEIAKLSLWLVTLAKDFPFTFVDHALKCGDSLVGASADDFERWAHVIRDSTMLLWKDEILGNLHTARQKRKELEGFVVRDVQDAARKTELLREAESATERVRRGADLMTGARLLRLKAQELESLLDRLAMNYGAGELFGEIDPAKHYDAARALQAAQKERVFHWEFAFPEVFATEGRGGFSAFVGNPPFLGGKRIGTILGQNYQEAIKGFYEFSKGAADICTYFFRKAYELLISNGVYGFIATNTIAQGDTKEVGLDYLVRHHAQIYKAFSSFDWPGQAGVYVSIIWIRKGIWNGIMVLDNNPADGISSSLVAETESIETFALAENKGFITEGIKIYGNGFVLETSEYENLLKSNPKYEIAIQPYLTGDDFVNHPSQKASRYAINFRNWEREKCEEFIDLFRIVVERVKPYRDGLSGQLHETRFWLYWDKRDGFFKSISQKVKILVCSGTTKYVAVGFVPLNQVISQKVKIFAFDDYANFSILQSTFHDYWARRKSSTLGETLSYSNSDSFATFPFPRDLSGLEKIGERYHETRRQIMLARQEGLTKTYNRFHNPEEQSADIVELRRLHIDMDSAVAAAYGWEELELGHDFHETAQGIRFTISESARREVLSRLLALNHERHEEEMKNAELGMQNKGKGRKAKTPRPQDDGQIGLF